jgi:hypothetical protein
MQRLSQDTVITFTDIPSLCDIPSDESLEASVRTLKRRVGYNTNFDAVFKLILSTAKTHGVKQEDMIKKVFVFSDMEVSA